MKVTEITCQHLLSGIGRYGVELSKELKKLNILSAFYKPYKEGHADSVLHSNEWIKPINYRSFRNLHPYLLPLFIRKAVSVSDEEVLHAHWFISGLAISLFTKNPKIITMHDVSLLHLPEQNPSYIMYYKWVINRFKKLGIPIIVVSEQAKKDAIKYANYPSELIHVVYNGINHDQFFPKQNNELRPSDRFRIVYSGGLGKRKNVGLLLEAFQKVEQSMPNIELVISGAHPERTEYPQKVIQLGLKNVSFTGYLPDEDMADFYRSGHCMVFPSEYEGFGLAPLESMACGTPVLCAKGGALMETSGDGAEYFDYDSEDLASKIILLFNDVKLQYSLTKRGIEQAKKYTWKRTADETVNLYRSLI